MWGSSRPSIKTIADFSEAEARYEKIVSWKPRTRTWVGVGGRKPLTPNRGITYMNIRPVHKGRAYACELYSTDVVTYEAPGLFAEQGSILIQGYTTTMTANFVLALVPNGIVYVSDANALKLDDPDAPSSPNGWGYGYWRYPLYRIPDDGLRIVRKPDEHGRLTSQWVVHTETTMPKPYVERVPNRERARVALLKHNFYDFQDWAHAYNAMRYHRVYVWRQSGNYELIEMLRDRNRWSELLTMGNFFVDGTDSNWGKHHWGREVEAHFSMSKMFAAVRRAVYQIEEVYDEVQHPRMENYKAFINYTKREAKR